MKENGFDFIDAILLLWRTWTIPRMIKNNQHQNKNPCNRRPSIETREVRIDFSFRREVFFIIAGALVGGLVMTIPLTFFNIGRPSEGSVWTHSWGSFTDYCSSRCGFSNSPHNCNLYRNNSWTISI